MSSISWSILWGGAGFGAFVVFSLISAQILQRDPNADYGAYLLRHTIQVATEKIVGLAIVALVAVFAARSFRPTAMWGLITSVIAGLAFQFAAICVYFARFGGQAYTTFNRLILTLLWTLGIAFVFGTATIWKQLKNEQNRNV